MTYLTREESAKHLRISTRTLDRLITEGEIIGARIGGRRLLFRQCDLDAYVEKLMRKAAV